jgi:metacaspase-1
MATGLSLHIGLDRVDPGHYQGWSGPLNACEADAKDMKAIATSKGFHTTSLLTAAATRQAVADELRRAASQLQSGDIFLLSYSGHGGQLPDRNGDETDQQDETWCLYDGELVDDELYSLLGRFRTGVRVAVFSDSCHSGTVVKMAFYTARRAFSFNSDPDNSTAFRFMPNDVAFRVYTANKDMYDPILNDASIVDSRSRVSASVLLISGCQDNQLSADGAFNGLFTGTLLRTWANGAFTGNYQELRDAIVRKMPPDQTPKYFTVGIPNSAFETQSAFTI